MMDELQAYLDWLSLGVWLSIISVVFCVVLFCILMSIHTKLDRHTKAVYALTDWIKALERTERERST